MSISWCFVEVRKSGTRRRITPPSDVRDLVVTRDVPDERGVHFGLDLDTGLGVVSNRKALGEVDEYNFVYFGWKGVDSDNIVVMDPGFVDGAFRKVEHGDRLVFLADEKQVQGDDKYLYLIHEDTFYEMISETPE